MRQKNRLDMLLEFIAEGDLKAEGLQAELAKTLVLQFSAKIAQAASDNITAMHQIKRVLELLHESKALLPIDHKVADDMLAFAHTLDQWVKSCKEEVDGQKDEVEATLQTTAEEQQLRRWEKSLRNIENGEA